MNKSDLSKKSVLVTGASSGIGKSVAVYLAAEGYTVLATVRKAADSEMLRKSDLSTLNPMYPLDLTNQDQIHNVARSVTDKVANKEIPPLFAIINVAGGGNIAPIELMNISDFRDELEKRLVGPVALLQELLPLLRQTRGRVLWIATPALFPVPYVADIHAPDFAVNYLARTLNLELRPDGIKNILIRCGGIATSSPERTEAVLYEKLASWPKEKGDIYRERLTRLLNNLSEFNRKRTKPEKVARMIGKVLEKRNPKTRYQVGYMAGMGNILEKLPQAWVDYLMEKREN